MAEQELKTIYLFRSGVIIADTSGGTSAMGERGYLVVGNNVLHTIERTKIGGSNSTRLPTTGTFECTMVKTQKLPKGLWITQTGEFGHNQKNSEKAYSALKIHAANTLSDISGCVAPGRIATEKGVAESKAAMEDIFTYCGGWGEGKKVMLEVDSL